MKFYLMTIFALCFSLDAFCGGASNPSFEEKIAYFCATEHKFESLSGYAGTNEERFLIRFAFEAMGGLLENPQRASLNYSWKMSKIDVFIDSLDTDKIPLKYVPVLFKAL